MSLLITSTQKIFERDLSILEKEISLYQSEESIWLIQKEIKNSSGNLCLHLCGNLQYYVGAVLGNSEYIRNRELEFSAKNIPKEKLIHEVQTTKRVVMSTLDRLGTNSIEMIYPVDVFKEPMTIGHFLIHLTAHLGYHLGQINYHRRLI